MKLRTIVATFTLPLFITIACGGSSESNEGGDGDGDGDAVTPPSSSEGKEATCAAFCEALSECDDFDSTDCEENCSEGESTSRSGQEVITECFTTDVCEATEVEGLEALTCVTEGLEDLPLSDEAETFCSESVDTINDCLGSEPAESPLGGCEATIGLASDELIAELNDCAEESCEDVEQCVGLEALQAFPLDAIDDLESGDISPAVLAELLAVAAVFGQLGLDDSAVPFPPGAGGAGT